MTNYQKPRNGTPACDYGPPVCTFSMFWGSAKNAPSSELQSLTFTYIIDFKVHNAVCGKNLLDEDTGTAKDAGQEKLSKDSTVGSSQDEGVRGIVTWCFFS